MDDRFILESFWQKEDNCTTVALIKAAIIKYGINRVFKTARKNNHLLVTLKDGKLLTLTNAEIRKLNKTNLLGFRRPRDAKQKNQLGQVKKYVRLCFAVIVRNIQLHGYEGKEYTRTEAIDELISKGMKTDHIHRLLGLQRKTSSSHQLALKHLKSFKRKKAILLYSDTHIVVASSGYYDNYGDAEKIGEEPPVLEGRKAKSWYELK